MHIFTFCTKWRIKYYYSCVHQFRIKYYYSCVPSVASYVPHKSKTILYEIEYSSLRVTAFHTKVKLYYTQLSIMNFILILVNNSTNNFSKIVKAFDFCSLFLCLLNRISINRTLYLLFDKISNNPFLI